MTKLFRPCGALAILIGLLAGCGGGAHNAAPAARSGRATFVVHWPPRNTRLIPAASDSIVVVITRNNTQVATQILPRPANGTSTTATFTTLPVNNLVATATAFPNDDGSGVAQATGTTSLAITANTNTMVNLTMGTTITNVVLAPPPSLVVGGAQNSTAEVFATAMDANGNIVLTLNANWVFSTSNDKIATVVKHGASATVTAAGIGVANITALESESNVSGQTQATARGQGLLVNTWAKFRADTNNTGLGFGTIGFRGLIWSVSTGGPVESSPAVGADGTIYVGSADGNLYAFNPADGSVKWTAFLGGRIKSSPAIASDGTIYVASSNGQIAAIEKADGSQKWNESFGGSFVSSPAIGPNGTVYIAGEDSQLRAIDGANGGQIWQTGFSSAIESSPALSTDGSALYIGGGDGFMYAINTADGSTAWRTATGGAIQSSPALDVTSNVLYFGSDDGNVYALNAKDGSQFWASPFQTGGAVACSPGLFPANRSVRIPRRTAKRVGTSTGRSASSRGSSTLAAIIVGSSNGTIYALDPNTGASLATFTARSAVRSSPAISGDGVVAIGSDDDTIYLLSYADGSFFNSGSTSTGAAVTSSPAIVSFGGNGVAYVGSTDNFVYAVSSTD